MSDLLSNFDMPLTLHARWSLVASVVQTRNSDRMSCGALCKLSSDSMF